MQGVKRVFIFCLLTTIIPSILLILPLYLRHSLYADVMYAVTESDVLEISDGISTIFCSAHTLHTNTTFNAFQMSQRPEITSNRVHLRLKKSMTLPDDTLEYWGFYLLRGATVALSVCSRFPGASVLVVKGERILRTCGMLNHNKNKERSQGMFLPQAQEQVKITFESNAHEVQSEEITTPLSISSNVQNNDQIHISSMLKFDENITDDDVALKKLTAKVRSYYHRHMAKIDAEKRNHTNQYKHIKNRRIYYTDNTTDNILRESKLFDSDKEEKFINNEQNQRDKQIKILKKELNTPEMDIGGEENDDEINIHLHRHERVKRNQDIVQPLAILNQGIKHGGNALRNLTGDDDSSVSSFEEGLLNCYEGNVLLAQEFEPSNLCTDVSFLENSKYMQSRHNVAEDGYYYYIFYSDNDFVSNDIHAVFDIYKPTFQYENVTESCINQTKCTFTLSMLSSDRVIVEIPTRDGIDHEEDDISLLISVCHPRVGIYIIFPIAILFLILSCASL